MPKRTSSAVKRIPAAGGGAAPAIETREATIPTTFHLPLSLHKRLNNRATAKRVKMREIVIDGIRLALESPKYQLTDDERRSLLGE